LLSWRDKLAHQRNFKFGDAIYVVILGLTKRMKDSNETLNSDF
jgi:hypothetical protein